MEKFGRVIVDIASSYVDKIFDYILDFDAPIGSRVLVPFGKIVKEGYLIDICDTSNVEKSKLKRIICTLEDFAVLKSDQLELANYLKKRYNIGLCDSIRLFLPSEMRSGKVKELLIRKASLVDDDAAKSYLSGLRKNATKQAEIINYLLGVGSEDCSVISGKFGGGALKTLENKGIVKIFKIAKLRTPLKDQEITAKSVVLTANQQQAVDTILKGKSNYLLHGVTGSGKTEIYMALMENVLKSGKTGIMLVPEISLTPQVVGNFRARFGDSVALLHSGLSSGERFDEWKRILMQKAKIVVGARSAIFAPLENLGLIVIDEEHDSSYKSDSHPRYNTLEVAQERARICGCSLVLGSATPDLESYHKAMTHEYKLIELKERINKKPLPPLTIVDMCEEVRQGNNSIFSRELVNSLSDCIKSKSQAMIFINRRGYSSYLMCKECGWVAKCENCDTALVYHKFDNALKCHLCTARYKVFSECPNCGNKNLKHGSIGTEQVVEELNKMFPDVKVLRMDNDTTSVKDGHYKILSQFRKGEAQILVGTQMIAKGHDFPSVTLVGILDADQSLYQSSYQATEKTFQLITQVAGRAGRADLQGKIILQTYVPRHYVYKMASNYDYLAFYKKEANLREITNFPPFATIVRLLVTCEKEELAKSQTLVYYNAVKKLKADYDADNSFAYLGVSKSPIGRIQGKFRYQILMRIKPKNFDEILSKIYNIVSEKQSSVSVYIELNPQNLS